MRGDIASDTVESEGYDQGLSTKDAISHGIRGTAGVVTSAAAVMVAVFAIFATLSQVSIKQVGVGLAVAVLVDATVVRAILLPAVMTLLGDKNWYLPAWLNWIPKLSHDPGPVGSAPVSGVARTPSAHGAEVPELVGQSIRP